MKTMYLKNSEGKYEKFTYNTLTDIVGEFISRGIAINDKIQVIGDNARIGNSVTINSTTVIGNNVTVEDNSVISSDCIIRNKVFIGSSVVIESDVVIADECVVGNSVTLRTGIRLGKLAKIEDGVDLQDRFLLIGSVGEMTYVGNGKVCIGCTSATPEEWEANGVSLGRDYGYTEDQIGEYTRYVYAAKDFINNLSTPA